MPMMYNHYKKLLRLAGIPLAILVIAVIAYRVAGRDQALRLDVSMVLAARHDVVPPAKNLFFPLIAFDLQSSNDINADGQRLYGRHVTAVEFTPGAPHNLASDAAYPRVSVVGDTSQLCGQPARQEDCVERATADPSSMVALVSDNSLLVGRYQSLENYQRFENRLRPTEMSAVIYWAPFLMAKRLLLTSIALDIAQGRVPAAVERLQADTVFTRRILAEREMLLIDKIILAASLRHTFLFAGDVLRHVSLSDPQYATLRELAAPITPQERSLAGALGREYEVVKSAAWARARALRASREGVHFYKPNAALNGDWTQVDRVRKASEGACLNLRSTTAPAADVQAGYGYNPIGKLTGPSGASYAADLVGVFCDLQAMQRIVALQISIHSQRIPDAQLGVFIAQSPPVFSNPYTGKPFDWNATAKGVDFAVGASRDRSFLPWPL